MNGKRLELTEEERAVMVEALKFWRRRDMIPEWQQREVETRRVKDVAAALVERINAPDDPTEQFFSPQVVDAVKAGQCGILEDNGEVWGALVPEPVYRLVKRIREEVGDWTGAWTVVRLVEPVASDMDDAPILGTAVNLAELESVCPTS